MHLGSRGFPFANASEIPEAGAASAHRRSCRAEKLGRDDSRAWLGKALDLRKRALGFQFFSFLVRGS